MARNKLQFRGTTYDRLSAGSVHLARSPLPETLEANTLSVTVETESRIFLDFVLDEPVVYVFRSRQMGIFYLQSVQQVSPNKYSLYATDAVGLLTKRAHRGGVYTGQTVEEICPDLFGPIPYRIKTNLSQTKLYGWLPYVKPPDASARDNLLQILFAIGAVVKVDRDGVIRIEGLWDGIISTAGQNRMGQGASVVRDAKVTSVSVTEHQYTPGTESVELFEGTAQQGDEISFDDPVHSLSANGFTILESGANYAKISSGSGTLTGKGYIHNTRIVTKPVHEAQTENVKAFDNKTLVSLVNSEAVADRLVNYFDSYDRIQAPVVYQNENPGNLLSVYHPYDKAMVSACLESADITMSNKLKGDEVFLVGFVPPKFEQIVTYDEHELLTGSGNWIVPEGVTEVRLVLIQGGQAGYSGESGTGGGGSSIQDTDTNRTTVPSPSTGKTVNVSASASRSGASAGKGGSGGQGGSGGKVLQTTIEVTPGQTIAYACGNGGTSGGVSGGETTFGALSSAGGGTLPSGYTDIVTGITYAISGADGGDGSDGGANGASGGNAGNVSGGTGIASRSWNRTGRNSSTGVTTSATYSFNHGGMGGGGAGGPSGRNNGAVGKNAVFGGETYTSNGNMTGSASLKQNFGGAGGAGADGSNGSTYGSGGSGGGGGGGGGAAGNASVNTSVSSTFSREVTGRVSATATVSPPRAGAGGAGGSGGSGAAGCILLYYGVKEKIASGPIKTSNGKIFLDKFNRLMVV